HQRRRRLPERRRRGELDSVQLGADKHHRLVARFRGGPHPSPLRRDLRRTLPELPPGGGPDAPLSRAPPPLPPPPPPPSPPTPPPRAGPRRVPPPPPRRRRDVGPREPRADQLFRQRPGAPSEGPEDPLRRDQQRSLQDDRRRPPLGCRPPHSRGRAGRAIAAG